jgi:hypothetical protein
MNKDIKFLALLTCMMLLFNSLYAQMPIKHLSEKHKRYYDSLRNMDYDRVFPVFGSKVYKRGFDIPLPFGVMVNTFYCGQGLDISNINIGLRGPNESLGPINLDNVVEFGKVEATALNINVRADLWVFPFLNVYGLLAYLPTAETSVEVVKPLQISASPKQNGLAYGFGVMGAFGFGPVWLQGDYNLTWADMQLLQNKVVTQVAGIRAGHVFHLKNNAEKNISVWAGMMGIFLNSRTIGEIPLTKIFPGLTPDDVTEARQNYNNVSNLTPPQKALLDKIFDKLSERINGLPVEDIYITYEMDKAPATEWAGLVGVQYQINKRWQLRAESNFIGKDRLSVLTSVNYRFLGFKKKKGTQNISNNQ